MPPQINVSDEQIIPPEKFYDIEIFITENVSGRNPFHKVQNYNKTFSEQYDYEMG